MNSTLTKHRLLVTSPRLGLTAQLRKGLARADLTLALNYQRRRLSYGDGDASSATWWIPPHGRGTAHGHRCRGLPCVPRATIGSHGPGGGARGDGSPWRGCGGCGGRARGGVRERGFAGGRKRARRFLGGDISGEAAARRSTSRTASIARASASRRTSQAVLRVCGAPTNNLHKKKYMKNSKKKYE
jgi:hypothetical protein